MGIEPTRAATPELENKWFDPATNPKCDWRVNFRETRGHAGMREPTAVHSDVPAGIAGRLSILQVKQPAAGDDSATRCCQRNGFPTDSLLFLIIKLAFLTRSLSGK